ncbi:MAG: hypothetical protein OXR68_07400 [Alphaproteobacteria bacterium]|nr:hypothetical protein [Alphaproteobacteria bacterium]MDD9920428.1 hypothetical protein [Alphaproteobacteria bacterium]
MIDKWEYNFCPAYRHPGQNMRRFMDFWRDNHLPTRNVTMENEKGNFLRVDGNEAFTFKYYVNNDEWMLRRLIMNPSKCDSFDTFLADAERLGVNLILPLGYPYRIDYAVDVALPTGDVVRHIDIPRLSVTRRYKKRATGNVTQFIFGSTKCVAVYDRAQQLRRKGIEIDGVLTRIERRHLKPNVLPEDLREMPNGLTDLRDHAISICRGQFNPFADVDIKEVILPEVMPPTMEELQANPENAESLLVAYGQNCQSVGVIEGMLCELSYGEIRRMVEDESRRFRTQFPRVCRVFDQHVTQGESQFDGYAILREDLQQYFGLDNIRYRRPPAPLPQE